MAPLHRTARRQPPSGGSGKASLSPSNMQVPLLPAVSRIAAVPALKSFLAKLPGHSTCFGEGPREAMT